MKIITWNVNGIRSVLKKGFMDFFNDNDADVYCIQETKVHDDDLPPDIRQIGALRNYKSYWYCANKKGYSGVAIITRINPLSVIHGVGDARFDDEGRVLTLEFDGFYLVNAYVVNSKRGLLRLSERMEFDLILQKFCESLRAKKPVVICGDLNVAHKEIDLENPKSNTKNAGFTIEERDSFTKFLNLGYLDVFRIFNNEPKKYTWWSYMFNSRSKNVGWRIDYFLISKEFRDKVVRCEILADVLGSDHCPVLIEILN